MSHQVARWALMLLNMYGFNRKRQCPELAAHFHHQIRYSRSENCKHQNHHSHRRCVDGAVCFFAKKQVQQDGGRPPLFSFGSGRWRCGLLEAIVKINPWPYCSHILEKVWMRLQETNPSKYMDPSIQWNCNSITGSWRFWDIQIKKTWLFDHCFRMFQKSIKRRALSPGAEEQAEDRHVNLSLWEAKFFPLLLWPCKRNAGHKCKDFT